MAPATALSVRPNSRPMAVRHITTRKKSNASSIHPRNPAVTAARWSLLSTAGDGDADAVRADVSVAIRGCEGDGDREMVRMGDAEKMRRRRGDAMARGAKKIAKRRRRRLPFAFSDQDGPRIRG